MIALGFCLLAFLLTYWAGSKSLGKGIVVLLAFGYSYGILRANLLTTAAHFIFDAGVLGLYLSQFVSSKRQKAAPISTALNYWVIILILWPTLVILMPFQPLMVSLVGFRSITLFIPVLLLGARLRDKDLVEICWALVALNLIAAGFAGAEYVLGLTRFYPISPVTMIIYASGDITGGFFRIPATFINAHAYGSTMVFSLPFLLAFWNRLRNRYLRGLVVLSILAALVGVLMAAARLSFAMAAVAVIASIFTTRMSTGRRVTFLLVLGGLAVFTLGQERLQRFKSLGDTEYVSDRIAGSVNRTFFEILTEHPMGNGLGGGGTAMPYFLQGEIRNPIGMENEYAMILAEQGVVGFLFWVGFIVWYLTRAGTAFAKGPWDNARRIGWCTAAFSIATAWIGIGVFSSIPATTLLLLAMGFTSVPPAVEPRAAGDRRTIPPLRYRRAPVPSVS
jgi:hypothetical protein